VHPGRHDGAVEAGTFEDVEVAHPGNAAAPEKAPAVCGPEILEVDGKTASCSDTGDMKEDTAGKGEGLGLLKNRARRLPRGHDPAVHDVHREIAARIPGKVVPGGFGPDHVDHAAHQVGGRAAAPVHIAPLDHPGEFFHLAVMVADPADPVKVGDI